MAELPTWHAGTILLKDGSHVEHQRFFEEICKVCTLPSLLQAVEAAAAISGLTRSPCCLLRADYFLKSCKAGAFPAIMLAGVICHLGLQFATAWRILRRTSVRDHICNPSGIQRWSRSPIWQSYMPLRLHQHAACQEATEP